jgi:hypothetical protein
MVRPITGTTPVKGSCVYCSANLAMTWVDHTSIDGQVIRLTEGPFCVNGHPQPLPQPEQSEDKE